MEVGDSMSVNQKMTAIANEIRIKSSLTDTLTLDQMVIDIAASPSPIGNVPDYVYAEADRVANILKNRKPANGIQFVTVADLHTGYSTQSDISGLHAVRGACLVKNKANLKYGFFLGDIAKGAKTDTLEAHKENVLEGRRRISIFII